jgi:phage minor structural protein
MYRIFYGDELIYTPIFPNDGYYVVDPTLTQELNKSATLTFTVPTTSLHGGSILPRDRGNPIIVKDDDEVIFRGRCISAERDIWNRRKIYCEDELGLLNDVVLRPQEEVTETVAAFLTRVLAGYNSRATDEILPGNVTVTETITYSYDYVTAWSAINSNLLSKLEGYLFIRHETVNGVDKRYLDYLASSGEEVPETAIRFGENLIDLSSKTTTEDLYTVIIPTGKSTDGKKLTIKSVTQGNVDYLASSLVSSYGVIEKVVDYPDIEDATALKNKAQSDLDAVSLVESITVKAMDFSLVGRAISRLRIGNSYPLVAPLQGYNSNMIPLSRMVLKLDDPSQSDYTFGAVIPTLSRRL